MKEKWTKTSKKLVTNLYGTCRNMTKTQRNIFFETVEISNLQNMTKNR